MANALQPALNLTSEDLDSPEKRANYPIGLIGCGKKAVLCALAFADVGFRVSCVDSDQSLVRQVAKGTIRLGDREVESKLKRFLKNERVSVSADFKSVVSGSSIIVVTVEAKIDAKGINDLSEVEKVCKQIGSSLNRGSLFIYGGIAGLGFVEKVKELLENSSGLKVGEDFGLAYVPLSNRRSNLEFEKQNIWVGANNKNSLSAAALIFETVAKNGVKKIASIKNVELVALFAGAKQDVNLALANELAVLCENAGVDYIEIADLLGSTVQELSIPSIAEEQTRMQTYLLLESAENLDSKLRVLGMARQMNESMARHALSLIQDVLRKNGKTLRRARVSMLGAVESETSAYSLVSLLLSKGAKISRYDPFAINPEKANVGDSLRRTLNEAVEGADLIVILSENESLRRLNLKKLHAIMRSPAALVDLVGFIDPLKAEAVGLRYRGLGRGELKA
jgi:nucleotide sugar dehydrogenase